MTARRPWPTATSSRVRRSLRTRSLGPRTPPTRVAHRVLCALAPLWRVLGADPRQVATLTGCYLLFDERRGKASQTGEQPSSPFTGGMLLTLVMNLLVGGGVGVALFLDDPVWAMGVSQGLILCVTSMVLVTDYSAVLLDEADAAQMAPLPVSDRTLLAARIAHIAAYLSLTVGSLALPGLILGSITWGVVAFPAIWILSSMLTGVLAIGLSFGMFLVAARFLPASRFKDATLYLQIGASVLFVGGFQVIPRLISKDLLARIEGWFPWFAWLVPSFHQGGLLALADGGHDGRHIALAVLALALPLGLMLGLARLGSRGFLAGISSRYGSEEAAVSPEAWQVAPRRFADPEQQAGADFLAILSARDRNYRLRAWPLVAIALLISLGIALQKGGFDDSSNRIVLAVYVLGAYAPIFLLLTRYSQDWEARWMFQVAPLRSAGPFLAGAWSVLALRRIVPILLVGVVFVALVGGLVAAAHGVFASGVGLALFSLISGEFTRTLPFTRKPVKKDTSSLGLMFGAMFAAGLVGVVHFLLATFAEPVIYVGGPVFWLLGLFLLRQARFRKVPVRFET